MHEEATISLCYTEASWNWIGKICVEFETVVLGFDCQYIDVLEYKQIASCFSACSLTQHLAGVSPTLLVVPQTTSCNEILNLYSIAMNHILT